MAETFDVIVVGLGAMGSAALYHLAKQGYKALGIEQFALGHALGSSHGESRIIRYAYTQPTYVEMAKHAYPLWREVEQDTGKSLVVITGGLTWGKPDNPDVQATKRSLELSGVAHEWLNPAQVAERYPQFALPPDEMAVYQADAGFVRATESVLTHALAAQKMGAKLLTETPVIQIDLSKDGVSVKTATETFSAGHLVLTAGPWAGKVLGKMGLSLPLQPTREILTFFATEQPELFTPERCPSWIYHGDEKIYYGICNADGVSGFKAAQHGRHEPTDPDMIDRVTEQSYVDEIRAFLGKYIPKGAGELLKTYVCMYTMTPDEDFIIDRHPDYPHVAIGAGFSGHGFKFATLIGKMLGGLATGRTDFFYDDLFRLTRFKEKTK
jgi:sarcosine oxidase